MAKEVAWGGPVPGSLGDFLTEPYVAVPGLVAGGYGAYKGSEWLAGEVQTNFGVARRVSPEEARRIRAKQKRNQGHR
jgi:hypothetical protein